MLAWANPLARERVQRAVLAFGRAVARVVALPVMALLFYAVVTPAGWLMRLLGHGDTAVSSEKSRWREPETPDHDLTLPY